MSRESGVIRCLLLLDISTSNRGTGVPAVLEIQQLDKTAVKAELKFQMFQYCRELDFEELDIIERVPLQLVLAIKTGRKPSHLCYRVSPGWSSPREKENNPARERRLTVFRQPVLICMCFSGGGVPQEGFHVWLITKATVPLLQEDMVWAAAVAL